jgi:hypothetical protein
MSLPCLSSLGVIAERLPLIFPEGIEHRGYVTRDIAVKTVYVMLYAGAIEGTDRWIRPSYIYFMTEEQARRKSDKERETWYVASLKPRYRPEGKRWYADNSREPIRDETMRGGLIPYGAIIERQGIPTTSSTPKYALEREFAELFDEELTDRKLHARIKAWQDKRLNKSAIARIALIKKGAVLSKDAIQVRFPNGEMRRLAPGPSSVIAKAVIEEFAPRFLHKPAVLWLSESGNKVVAHDDDLALAIGLKIDASKNLPDIILVDLGDDSSDVLLVFVEVVATDGPISATRKTALRKIALEAGFAENHLAYLTAFADRSAPPYKKLVNELAWDSFVWFASEPDNVVILREGHEKTISQLR